MVHHIGRAEHRAGQGIDLMARQLSPQCGHFWSTGCSRSGIAHPALPNSAWDLNIAVDHLAQAWHSGTKILSLADETAQGRSTIEIVTATIHMPETKERSLFLLL